MYEVKLRVGKKYISTVMQSSHDSNTAGHSSYLRTLYRLKGVVSNIRS